MRNNIQGWPGCIKLCLWLFLLLPVTTGVTAEPITPNGSCSEPSGIAVTGKTSSAVSFAWFSVGGATSYQVYWVRLSDNTSSSVMTTSASAITVSGLSPGTYRFYFATVCAEGTSDYVVPDEVVITYN